MGCFHTESRSKLYLPDNLKLGLPILNLVEIRQMLPLVAMYMKPPDLVADMKRKTVEWLGHVSKRW
jgi:hypothetical protein